MQAPGIGNIELESLNLGFKDAADTAAAVIAMLIEDTLENSLRTSEISLEEYLENHGETAEFLDETVMA